VNGSSNAQRVSWRGPVAVWLGLLVLFGVTTGSAFVPLGPFNIALNLLIAAIMLALLVTFLMDLRHSTTLLRLLACAGLFWTVFMFALTFTDYLSRYY